MNSARFDPVTLGAPGSIPAPDYRRTWILPAVSGQVRAIIRPGLIDARAQRSVFVVLISCRWVTDDRPALGVRLALEWRALMPMR